MLADKLTIIVVTYNSMKVLPSFFQHLKNALDGEQCPILVCDNCSQDGVDDFLKKYWPNVSFLGCDKNEGYGAAINRGIIGSKTPFVAIMNPDVAAQRGGLKKLVAFMEERPLASGVSGAIIHLYENLGNISFNKITPERRVAAHFGYYTLKSRILFYSGFQTKFKRFNFLVPWSLVPASDSISVSRLNGSFGVYRREALIKVGMFDPRLFLYFEEDDIALRLIKKGYKLYVTDRTMIIHAPGSGSALSGSTITDKILLNSQYVFFRKHYGLVHAWVSFFSIWGVLSIVMIYQTIFCRPGRKISGSLWVWHLKSFLNKGRLPPGTIPDGGKEGVDYNWRTTKK